jgi:hypothetical protein
VPNVREVGDWKCPQYGHRGMVHRERRGAQSR